MAGEDHRIGRLTVEVVLGDLGTAMELRGRIEDLSWRLILPVVERVFDRLAPGRAVLEIARLTVDLGTLSPARLEEEALAALEPALVRAVSEALAGGAAGLAPRRLAPEVDRLERFATYLTSGTLPLHGRDEPFDPLALLRQAIAETPAALVALLRRLANRRTVLERLVLQLGAAGLADLLRLLAPADAAAILAFFDDLSLLQKLEPPLPISDPALRRLLWLVTLDYLLNDAGTQFNRRDYVAFLLARAGEEMGIAYAGLLDRIATALAAVSRQRPLGGSLLGVLHELCIAEAGLAGDREAAAIADGGAAQGDAEAAVLLDRITAVRSDRSRVAALLHPVAEPLFRRLIGLMTPGDAPLILEYLSGLLSIHREETLVLLSPAAFGRLLRLLTVLGLLRDGGSVFNRRSWLRRLIGELAEEEATSYATLLGALARAVPRLSRLLPPASSLPALVADLAAELPKPDGGVDTPPDSALADGDLPALLRLDARQRQALLRSLTGQEAGWVDEDLERLVGLGEGRTAALAWAIAVRTLLRLRADLTATATATLTASTGLPDRVAFWRALTGELARRLGTDILRRLQESGSLPAWIAEAAAEAIATVPAGVQAETRDRAGTGPAPMAAASWPILEAFLTTGRPPVAGPRLLSCLRLDPAGFGLRIRALAAATPTAQEALVHRLLSWLAPDELFAALAPGQSVAALRWLSLLADRPGGDPDAAAREAVGALLTGEPARIPDLPAAYAAATFDRSALLRHWLDHGSEAWWAPAEPGLDALLDGLLREGAAAVHSLFFTADRDRLLARLARACDLLGTERGEVLLRRLAPLIGDPGGALADLLARGENAAPERRRAILLRAAAAAVAGAPLDWAGLPRPLPPQAPLSPDCSDEGPDQGAVGTLDRSISDAALLSWLGGDPAAGLADPVSAGPAMRRLAALLDGGGAAVTDALRLALADPRARARWADLPEEILARLLLLIDPARGRLLHRLTILLAAAWREEEPATGRRTDPDLPWRLMLEQVADPRHRPLRAMVEAIARGLAGDGPSNAGPTNIGPTNIGQTSTGQTSTGMTAAGGAARTAGIQARLLDRAAGLALRAGEAALAGTLRPPPPSAGPAGSAGEPGSTARRSRPAAAEPGPQDGEAIYVGNAGLVLFGAFLPLYFDRLEVLTTGPDGRRRIGGVEAATRAVHMLQYLVDGRCDRPEPDLVLNKLLCGFTPATPVGPSIEPADRDRALADSLIASVIQHWTIINNTSPAGLRETFLQREGKLTFSTDRWTLTVNRRTVDVLVDRVPWSLSPIFHPWMGWPLHVTW